MSLWPIKLKQLQASIPHTVSQNNVNSVFFYDVTKSELMEAVNELKN